MLDSILLHSSGLKKGNYSKFILTLSPVDKASVVPGVSCSILSDRLVCTKAGMGHCLGWEGAHRWTRLQHTETVPQLRVCVCVQAAVVCGCVHTKLGACACAGLWDPLQKPVWKPLWGLLDLLALKLPTALIARVLLWDWGRQDIKQWIVHPVCPEGSEVMVCSPCLQEAVLAVWGSFSPEGTLGFTCCSFGSPLPAALN